LRTAAGWLNRGGQVLPPGGYRRCCRKYRQNVETPPLLVHDLPFILPRSSDASVPASGVVVYFECQDIDAVCSALAERGIAFDSTPTDQNWLWREAYLRDPDGRRHPPWRLGQGAEASGQSDQLPPPHLRG
jgi:hypothetical protein